VAAKGERIEKLEAYVKQLVPPPHTYCSPYRTPYCSHRSGLCDLRDVRREVELPSEGYAAPPRPAARAADAPRPAPMPSIHPPPPPPPPLVLSGHAASLTPY